MFFSSAVNSFYDEQEKRADRRRQNAAAFAQFKQQNPNATMQDYEMFISGMVGGEPGLRRYLPGQQDLQRMADENRRKMDEQRKREEMEWGYRNLQMEQAAEQEIFEAALNGESAIKAIDNVRQRFNFIGEDSIQNIVGRLGGTPEQIEEMAVSRWVNQNMNAIQSHIAAGGEIEGFPMPAAVSRRASRLFGPLQQRVEQDRRRQEQERAAALDRQNRQSALALASQIAPMIAQVGADARSREEFDATADRLLTQAFGMAGLSVTPEVRGFVTDISMNAARAARIKAAQDANAANAGPREAEFASLIDTQQKLAGQQAKDAEAAGDTTRMTVARAVQALNMQGIHITGVKAQEAIAMNPDARKALESGDYELLAQTIATAGVNKDQFVYGQGGARRLVPLDNYIQSRFEEAKQSNQNLAILRERANANVNPNQRVTELRKLLDLTTNAMAENQTALSLDEISQNVAEPMFAIDTNGVSRRVDEVRRSNAIELDAIKKAIEQDLADAQEKMSVAEQAKAAALERARRPGAGYDPSTMR